MQYVTMTALIVGSENENSFESISINHDEQIMFPMDVRFFQIVSLRFQQIYY